jgi:cell division protein FtsQ
MKKQTLERPSGLGRGKDISLGIRAMARIGGVGIVFSAIAYGVIAGGYVTDPNDPLYNIKGKVAAEFGYAARDIRVSGLKRQRPAAVLRAIHVRPNDSLIGFDARTAQAVLEKVDWISKAEVRRIYPNQLEIDVVERVPFAIWQRDGEFYVIDKEGAAFTSLEAGDVKSLFVVTGEGAHKKVFELVNHIEAHKGLKSKIAAAGRIGGRRWNLYLKNGMTVLLPEKQIQKGLARYVDLEQRLALSAKNVASVDLRFDDRLVVTPVGQGPTRLKVSQK